jgi:ABC-type molybdate transport system substrate-binding protein
MQKRHAILAACAIALTAGGCSSTPEKPAVVAGIAPQPAPAKGFAVIPKGKDNDLKLYLADGRIVKGADALARMQKETDLILWLAGNQFFAMDEVVKAFQRQNAGTRVGLITLPPGLILNAILGGGWSYEGRAYPGLPDVYASVNLGHLRKLKGAGLMDRYAVYMHNELEIMVARGNPKNIRGIKDLVRSGIRTSMPNPVNEGIMQFYARKVLERHGIWPQISGGKECYSCQTTPANWFTSVHHRETPDRIKAGTSDAGIVWKTETQEAIRGGAPVEGVVLPPEDSLRDEVAYAIGAIASSPRRVMADRYLEFLKSPGSRAAYVKYGFVYATPKELELKPIP